MIHARRTEQHLVQSINSVTVGAERIKGSGSKCENAQLVGRLLSTLIIGNRLLSRHL